ncbi:transposase [Streptomyces spectabilis]|uniref:Putative transposase n=1 Tax=Streptomyces spectabilis TaxID=68270 RepID=A0A7W8B2P8_STRST|nr:transposase [Streptomyces spectabilis]MBB5109201.1 putative transposase [Streptomyces spectabilis]MCI3907757.1 transposase [Streptomyces spectabilis]GGV51338.1 putative transposase [Streptomyces spectabilis]
MPEVLKAYRFTLDPRPAQVEMLLRHAGAARWAFNHALGIKVAAHQEWRRQVQALVDQGVPEAEARRRVKVPVPSKPTIQKHLNSIKGDSRKGGLPEGALGPERPCPWWHEVNTYAFQSAFADADRAWQNWLDSRSGKRAGRAVGYPRFKKKGRARDAFRLHHDVKRPGIRPVGCRRLRLPTVGEVRLHDSAKRLVRLLNRGQAQVQSVSVSRGGHRWYASVLCKVVVDLPGRPSKVQVERGTVGVDLGVKYLAALSQPLDRAVPMSQFVRNPRHLVHAMRRLVTAQRALSRTQKGSARRLKARRRVGQLHHDVAVRRDTVLHAMTKQLSTRFAMVAVEDLNVAGMTRSARGTLEKPGRRVRQKAGLNQAILDVAPGEVRRQLAYKTVWYGSKLAVLDRWFPSSKTCSACGWQNPRLTLADRTFHCGGCGLSMDRDENAARNIARHAVPADTSPVAPGRGETRNARGAPVSPSGPRVRWQGATKREDAGPPGPVPPQRSNPLTLPTPHGQQPAKGS